MLCAYLACMRNIASEWLASYVVCVAYALSETEISVCAPSKCYIARYAMNSNKICTKVYLVQHTNIHIFPFFGSIFIFVFFFLRCFPLLWYIFSLSRVCVCLCLLVQLKLKHCKLAVCLMNHWIADNLRSLYLVWIESLCLFVCAYDFIAFDRSISFNFNLNQLLFLIHSLVTSLNTFKIESIYKQTLNSLIKFVFCVCVWFFCSLIEN